MPDDHSSLASVFRELGIPLNVARVRSGQIAEAEMGGLVSIAETPKQIQLLRPAAAAWFALREAAARDGIAIEAVSGFRSVGYQADIFRRKLRRGLSIAEILRVNLPPGFSEHHSGRAVDIAVPGMTPLTEEFAQTPAFEWLCRHAKAFGFSLSYPAGNPQGLQYEPWHWLWASTPAS